MFDPYESKRTTSRAHQWSGTQAGATQIQRYVRDELPASPRVLYVGVGEYHVLRRPDELEVRARDIHALPDAPAFLVIPTLEGDMRADKGDWIIRGLVDELYPCKPDVFDRKYQRADVSPLLEMPFTIELRRYGTVHSFRLDAALWSREEALYAFQQAARAVVDAAYPLPAKGE